MLRSRRAARAAGRGGERRCTGGAEGPAAAFPAPGGRPREGGWRPGSVRPGRGRRRGAGPAHKDPLCGPPAPRRGEVAIFCRSAAAARGRAGGRCPLSFGPCRGVPGTARPRPAPFCSGPEGFSRSLRFFPPPVGSAGSLRGNRARLGAPCKCHCSRRGAKRGSLCVGAAGMGAALRGGGRGAIRAAVPFGPARPRSAALRPGGRGAVRAVRAPIAACPSLAARCFFLAEGCRYCARGPLGVFLSPRGSPRRGSSGIL